MGGPARPETIQHFYIMIQEGHGRDGRIRSLAHASYLKVTNGNERLLEDTERVLSVFSSPANRRAITIELRQAEANRIWLRRDYLPPDRYDTDDCFPFIESCLRTALEGTPDKNEVRPHGSVTLSGGSHGFSGDTFNLLPEFDHQIVVIDLSQFPRHPPDYGLTDRRWGGPYQEIVMSNEWVERLSAAAWEPFTQRNPVNDNDSDDNDENLPGLIRPRQDNRCEPNSLFRMVIRCAVKKWIFQGNLNFCEGFDEVFVDNTGESCQQFVAALEESLVDHRLLNTYLNLELSPLRKSIRDQAAAPYMLYILYMQTKHEHGIADLSCFPNVSFTAFTNFLLLLEKTDTSRITTVDITGISEVVFRTDQNVSYAAYHYLRRAFPNVQTIYMMHIGSMDIMHCTLPDHFANILQGIKQINTPPGRVARIITPSLFLRYIRPGIPSPWDAVAGSLTIPTTTSLTVNPIKQVFFVEAAFSRKHSSARSQSGGIPNFAGCQTAFRKTVAFTDVLLTPARLVQALSHFITVLSDPETSRSAQPGSDYVSHLLASILSSTPTTLLPKKEWLEVHPPPYHTLIRKPNFIAGRNHTIHHYKDRVLEHYPIVSGEWSLVVLVESRKRSGELISALNINGNQSCIPKVFWVGFVSANAHQEHKVLSLTEFLKNYQYWYPSFLSGAVREELVEFWERENELSKAKFGTDVRDLKTEEWTEVYEGIWREIVPANAEHAEAKLEKWRTV